MFAIVKSAFLDRDYFFFSSEWGETLCEETDIRILEKFREKYAEQISKKNGSKSRIVLEYELDGIYMTKDDFDKTEKVKGIECLVSDLEKLI